MMKLTTKEELEALNTDNVKEHLHLEYKASAAIDKKDDAKKLEMARDVSAFANADGGQIVYGMTEKNHEPAGLDAGLVPTTYPEIWFEQVLQQHITPSIVGLRPYHVPLANGHVAVVIDIPASKGDPHQVDGRYYRRHNYNRLIMEHYEVREAFHRATTPEPFVTLSLLPGDNGSLEFKAGKEISEWKAIRVTIQNRSNQPTDYAVVTIGVDNDLSVEPGSYQNLGVAYEDGRKFVMLRDVWSINRRSLPVFKEAQFTLAQQDFSIGVYSDFIESSISYITVSIQAPGFTSKEMWYVGCQQARLAIQPPRKS